MGGSDWRLHGQEKYLRGKAFVRRIWRETRSGWDHDHCEFCTRKFSDERIPDALHEGWTTRDNYHWICDQCFQDFRQLFAFKYLKM
jgi:hypothetical protein